MTLDLAKFAVGGAARPDALSGMNPDFNRSLAAMFAAAPPDVQAGMRLSSGYRSPEVQAGLYQNALQKYGSEQEARKWVAPPGRSQHNHGTAGDLQFVNDAARQWAHQNAGNYGLAFPLSNEPWHVELAGARQAQAAPMPPMPPVMPMPPQQPTQGDDPNGQRMAFPVMPPVPAGTLGPADPQPQAPQSDRIASMFAPGPVSAGLAAGQQYLAQEQTAAQQEQARRQKLAMMFGAA